MPDKKQKLYAFLATDLEGTVGIISVAIPGRGQHPLVAINRKTIAKMWPWAQTAALTSDVTSIRLIEFEAVRDLDPDNLPAEDEE